MTFEYIIEKNDLLTHALYMASKTKKVLNRRRFSWFIFPAVCAAGGFLLKLTTGSIIYMNMFLVIGLGWLMLHPFIYRKIVKKQLHIHLSRKFNHPEGVMTKLTIFGKKIKISDSGSESTIKISELKDIIELKDYLFLRLAKGGSIIIPSYKLDAETRQSLVDKLVNLGNLKHFPDTGWKWR